MSSHHQDLSPFLHPHAFADEGVARREKALLQVTLLTLVTMAVEVGAGWWTGSLALLADGWHMGTHALALGGAVLAYRLARRASAHGGYAFGGWKIEVLAAYTSGLLLLAAAAGIAWDAIATLREPRPIAFGEAMGVALLGLVVNLVSAWLLSRGGHDHHHGHADDHDHDHDDHPHGHHHHDANFGAAYLHVLADLMTSVLAIAALAGGLWAGWRWLDPAVALLGALVVGQWALGVLRQSSRALVDATAAPEISGRIRTLIEADGDARLSDLHVWQVGAQAWSAAIAIVADRPLPAAVYRARLAEIAPLRHVTVEVHRCEGCGEACPRG
ncbi:CDF family Co(II)/Ni(II) efflux transporter DmeF [Rubrivivax gelatinosus]|uniref:CDF family Co(II)/Ni(II) efflux transporter DmeF n=1 Tax=Rubrivivax gelatinosus TaxID=28068 RepID=UPI0003038309|nr:CDF family Co(II)/Ni(II) efflux transporter DmeF [Rubrivivax gelatinosus]MBG6080978.1 cation diffusion facilitator family transporter [Rubrivivax gelatinosus]